MVHIGGGRPFISIFIFGFIFLIMWGIVSEYKQDAQLQADMYRRITVSSGIVEDILSTEEVTITDEKENAIDKLKALSEKKGEKRGVLAWFGFLGRLGNFMISASWEVMTAGFVPVGEAPGGPWPVGWGWVAWVMKVPVWIVSTLFTFGLFYLIWKAWPKKVHMGPLGEAGVSTN